MAARGYKLSAVFNSFRLRSIKNYLKKSAAHHGIKLAIVDQDAKKTMREVFQQNEIFYLTFDLIARKGYFNWLPFGKAAINIDPGPAILALRYHMTVLPIVTYHSDADHSHVIIHPEMSLENETGRLRPNELCECWLGLLHEQIKRHPEQWWAWGFADLQKEKAESPATQSIAG